MVEVSELHAPVRVAHARTAGWKRIAASVAVIALLGPGCTTVRSTLEPNFSASPPSGLTYFLPMRQARLTLTRTPADPENLIAQRDQKVVALAAASAQAAAAKARREQAEAMLAALSPTAASRPDQVKVVELAKAQEIVLTDAANALLSAVEDLGRRIVAAQAAGGECRYTAKVELLPVQADPRARFVADLPHNYLRDDTVRLDVNQAGLLTSANVVAVDQTGQVFVELAGLAGSFAGASASAPAPRSGPDAAPKCDGAPVLIRVFDPVRPSDVDGVNLDIARAGFPFRIKMRPVIEMASDRHSVVSTAGLPSQESLGLESGNLPAADAFVSGLYYRSPTSVVMEVRFLPPLVTGRPATTASGQAADVVAADPSIVPPPETDTTAATDFGPRYRQLGIPVEAVDMRLPQAGPVSWVPMRASAFVKTTSDVQFVDGSLASWSSERPSEVLSIVRLPAQMFEAAVSGASEVLTARVEFSNNREALDPQ